MHAVRDRVAAVHVRTKAMHASRISVATLAALIAFAAFDEPTHADQCPPDFTPYIDVHWATDATGFVPVGRAAVMVAIDGDCNVRSAVPAAALRVYVSRTESGTFRPVAIERRGELFAWRPPAPGIWFVRVGRIANGRPPRTDGGAIVLAYEPTTQARVRFQTSAGGQPRGEGVALRPIVVLEVGDHARAGPRVSWLEPFLFLPYPLAVEVRLPRGRYGAHEGHSASFRADDTRGAPRRVEFFATSDARTGAVDIVSSGDGALDLQRMCEIPLRD